MTDTITIAKIELQQLLELVGVIEEAIEYVVITLKTILMNASSIAHKLGKR